MTYTGAMNSVSDFFNFNNNGLVLCANMDTNNVNTTNCVNSQHDTRKHVYVNLTETELSDNIIIFNIYL